MKKIFILSLSFFISFSYAAQSKPPRSKKKFNIPSSQSFRNQSFKIPIVKEILFPIARELLIKMGKVEEEKGNREEAVVYYMEARFSYGRNKQLREIFERIEETSEGKALVKEVYKEFQINKELEVKKEYLEFIRAFSEFLIEQAEIAEREGSLVLAAILTKDSISLGNYKALAYLALLSEDKTVNKALRVFYKTGKLDEALKLGGRVHESSSFLVQQIISNPKSYQEFLFQIVEYLFDIMINDYQKEGDKEMVQVLKELSLKFGLQINECKHQFLPI